MKPAVLRLAAALLLAASASNGRADLRPPRHCELHGPRDLQAGDPALGVLKARAGSLLRVCTAPGEATERLVVSAPVHSSAPVCRFTQQALVGTPGEGEAPIVQTYVRVGVGVCPAPEPSDYVRSDGVSDPEHVRLARFRREIGASAAAFDRAFLGFADAQAPVKPSGFAEFRRAILGGAVRVKAIYRPSSVDAAITMAFSDPADPSTTWRVSLELIAGKPVVRGFSAWIA